MRLVDVDGVTPSLVHENGGRRIWVMDSIAFGSDALAGDVIVTGSHGGASAGEYAAGYGVAAVVCNDAGVGKNDAGIAGLRELDNLGVAGVAVTHLSARIADGQDAWEHGVVGYANRTAQHAGVVSGVAVRDQVGALLTARPTADDASMAPGAMSREVLTINGNGTELVIMDSMSQAERADAGRILIAGSNGGRESGHVGVAARCALIVLNDAGVGKDEAGIAALGLLAQAGAPAATVGHQSAEISNGQDMWRHGVITHINEPAYERGARAGETTRALVARFTAPLTQGAQ